ncbi:MAG TPA: hypothetical protein VMV10_02915 [Pirellulales bacterium]|nr:hypothetical protein [Pirellulales bacterium]
MQRAVGAWSALVAGCLAASLSGCGAAAAPVTASIRPPAASTEPTADSGEPAIDREFAQRLLEIADEYAEYTLADRNSRLANGACFVPGSEFIPPQFSEAEEHADHGKKLYFLFARDAAAFSAAGAEGVQPVGQAIVKEAWAAREIRDSHQPAPFEHHSGLPVRLYAERGGRAFGADRQTELFIMFKLPPDAPGTDSGWVYGTVTADRQRVTSAGRIASCADCHRQSPGDRLFGNESQELASQPASPSDRLSDSDNKAL